MNTKLPMACVTIFFLSEEGSCIFMPFAIASVTKYTTIINAIEAHLRSSPSMFSKANVAIIPEAAAKMIRIQYRRSSFFVYDVGFGAGASGVFSGVFAISGVSAGGTSVLLDSGVGSDFFFLSFAN